MHEVGANNFDRDGSPERSTLVRQVYLAHAAHVDTAHKIIVPEALLILHYRARLLSHSLRTFDVWLEELLLHNHIDVQKFRFVKFGMLMRHNDIF
jgi:hypothetical protein